MRDFFFGSKIRLIIIIFLILVVSAGILIFSRFILPGLRTGDLSRSYPEFIKCSLVTEDSLSQLTLQTKELKESGTNTICVMTSVPQFESKKTVTGSLPLVRSAIADLKRQGFAIFLSPDVAGTAETEAKYSKITPEEFLSIATEEALKWAAIAEEYKVEYFAPHNELPSRLDAPESWFSDTREAVEASNAWHDQILPKVKEIFKGRAIAKFGYYLEGQDATGYDYVGITLDRNFMEDPTDKEEFRKKIKKEYQEMAKMAAAQNNKWLISEVYLPYDDVPLNTELSEEEKREARQILKNSQVAFFQITIDELLALPQEKRPVGYIPGGYGPGTYDPIDESITKAIKKFFNTYPPPK